MSAKWEVIRRAIDDQGRTIELRYSVWGKGRSKIHSWKIFRDNVQVGYGATEADALVNFERVRYGFIRNPQTGNYEAG
jgi:hypothetical protein